MIKNFRESWFLSITKCLIINKFLFYP
jgi:hypothetical protein